MAVPLTTDEPEVLVDTDGHVARITLNRPARRNAITARMLHQLTVALQQVESDPEVRCVLLTGAGKGFCSGLDIKDTLAGTGIGSSPEGFDATDVAIESVPTTALHLMNTPVIAVINGAAAGYGLDL